MNQAEKEESLREYAILKNEGKPFFPYAVAKDSVMAVIVMIVIMVLALLFGAELGPKVNPDSTTYVPRPDWYFYFLFYLLRIFKWPESVVIGTVGIPTVLLLLLFAMPFIDVRAERRPLRRPVALVASILVVLSMGILTYKGATAKEALASELLGDVTSWAQKQGFSNNPQAKAGARLFASLGCTNCHTYLGIGQHNLGAPDLSAEGAKNKGVAFEIAHLKCPSCVNAGSPMPSFAAQGQKNLSELAAFLVASKGPHS